MNIGKYNIDTTKFEWRPWSRSDIVYGDEGHGTVINLRGWLWFVVTDIETYQRDEN